MRNGWKDGLIVAATLLLATAPLLAAAAEAVDVAGSWEVTWEAEGGPQDVTVVFTQEGEKLTGTYTEPGELPSPVAGEVKGHAIEFAVDVETEDGVYTLTFRGTVHDDAMRGTMTAGSDPNVYEWTATRTAG